MKLVLPKRPNRFGWSTRILRGLGATFACYLLGCFAGFRPASFAQPAPASLPVLTEVKVVRDLTPADADRGPRVRLRGVVTFFNPGWPGLFVQDHSGGVFVMPNPGVAGLVPGNLVEVEGVARSGRVAPVVANAQVRVLGEAPRPTPMLVPIEAVASGRWDSQWVAARGVVRSATNVGGDAQLQIAQGAAKTTVRISRWTKAESLARLVDATVLVLGVNAAHFDDKRRLAGFGLFTASSDQVKVEKPAPEDPFGMPAQPISRLGRFTHLDEVHRVRVEGTVTLQRQGRLLFIEDKTGGLMIETTQPGVMKVGDQVEVVGFPAASDFSPILQDAFYRRVEGTNVPAAVRVKAAEANSLDYHGRLVRIQGHLLDSTVRPDARVLVLQEGGVMFPVFVGNSTARDGSESLREGSLLEVTGICLLDPSSDHVPRTFRILIGSTADVEVLTSPPWWTWRHSLAVIAGLCAIVLGALTCVVLLQRRVQMQTNIIRKRLEAEAALEERYRELFENATDLVYTHDLEGRYLSINKAVERMLGYSREEMLKLDVFRVIAPEYRELSHGMLQKKLQDGGQTTYELELLTKDGRRVWCEISSRLILEDGKPVGVHGVVRDITERKRVHDTLQTHAQVLESMAEGVALCAEDQTIVLTNAAFDAMFGYERGELAGKPVSIVNGNSPEEVAQMMPGMIEKLAKNEVWQGEFKSRRKDGTEFLAGCRMSALKLAGKRYVISVQQDITERRRAETLSAAWSNLGSRLSVARTQRQAAETIIELADEVLGWDACYLHLFSPDQSEVIPILHFDTLEGRRTTVPGDYADRTPSRMDREILEHGKKLILREQPAFENDAGLVPFGNSANPSASLMFVPIHHGGGVIGVLSIQSYTPRAYDASDLDTLQGLADHCGGALERVRAAQAFEDSERYFRVLIENSTDGISLIAADGTVLYASPTVDRVLGFSPAEDVGTNVFARIHPEDLASVRDRLAEILRRPGGIVAAQFRTRHKDGTWRWVEGTGTNLLDDPTVRGIVINYRDVTERMSSEHALRESERRFQKAFQATPVSTAISRSADARIVDVNDGFLQLFGFAREEVLGRTGSELGIWVNLEERTEIIRLVRAHQPVRNRECRLRTKSGRMLDTMISAELIHFGHEPCVLFITYDLTERLRLETQLRHSQKMEAVGQLAAGIAHDFNNIMTIIQGHASLLLAAPGCDEDASDALKKILVATERASGLTRQLLTFSRKQVMQARLIDLGQVIANVSKMLQRLLGENVTLECHCPQTLPAIRADAGMIEQAILNLAVNARDAMPGGGKLSLTAFTEQLDDAAASRNPDARAGPFVCLSVSDDGTGIEAKNLSRIFEPFFTTKEVGKGTGLGLSMVYGILKQHHGWIEVKSEPGRGATFELFFPAESQRPDPLAAIAPVTSQPSGTETILVVEDESALRHLVSHLLRRQGYQVIEARSGREALQVWREHTGRVDLLLTDIVMPEGISGVDLAEQLCLESPALKVLFTSGYSPEVVGQKVFLEEGVNFLPKPYHPPKLAKMVRQRLDSPAQVSKLR